MIESTDRKAMDRPTVQCSECDHEVKYYNTFLSPTNEERILCWECLGRKEKGFNASRGFQRSSRTGVIPR